MIGMFAAVAAVAVAGAWLRWAVIPVRVAYDLGRQVERLCARSHASASRANEIP